MGDRRCPALRRCSNRNSPCSSSGCWRCCGCCCCCSGAWPLLKVCRCDPALLNGFALWIQGCGRAWGVGFVDRVFHHLRQSDHVSAQLQADGVNHPDAEPAAEAEGDPGSLRQRPAGHEREDCSTLQGRASQPSRWVPSHSCSDPSLHRPVPLRARARQGRQARGVFPLDPFPPGAGGRIQPQDRAPDRCDGMAVQGMDGWAPVTWMGGDVGISFDPCDSRCDADCFAEVAAASRERRPCAAADTADSQVPPHHDRVVRTQRAGWPRRVLGHQQLPLHLPAVVDPPSVCCLYARHCRRPFCRLVGARDLDAAAGCGGGEVRAQGTAQKVCRGRRRLRV
mmetsp:Transcript_3151/g.6358  ORF Transcript_3151/g.6358 Transcript_3151/m.6358 type:complete len:338 (+) Transcript_3151:285-1298(+)